MGDPPILKNLERTSASRLRTRKVAVTSLGALPSRLEARGSNQVPLLHLTLPLRAVPPSSSSNCMVFVTWMQESSGMED